MAEIISIPISIFELTVDYSQPDLNLLANRAALMHEVFQALKPWKPSIDDIELRNNGSLSEQGTNFKIPSKRISFFVGPASCHFVRDAADWQSADETINILTLLLDTLVRVGNITVGKMKTSISMHVQPATLPFVEILKPMLVPKLAGLEQTSVTAVAAVAKWGEKRRVTIDGSASLANALFLRLERQFDAETTFGEMAKQLRKDEDDLFAILGIREELA